MTDSPSETETKTETAPEIASAPAPVPETEVEAKIEPTIEPRKEPQKEPATEPESEAKVEAKAPDAIKTEAAPKKEPTSASPPSPTIFPLASLRVRKRPSAPFFALVGPLLLIFTGVTALARRPTLFAAAPIGLAVWVILFVALWSVKEKGAVVLTDDGLRVRKRDFPFDSLKSVEALSAAQVLLREANGREVTLTLDPDAATGASELIASHVTVGKRDRAIALELVPTMRTLGQLVILALLVVALSVVTSHLDARLWSVNASITGEVLGITAFFAPIIAGFVFCIRASIAQAIFGDQGVRIDGMFRTRFIPWSEIAAVDVNGTALDIRRKGSASRVHVRVVDFPAVERDALIARVARSLG